MSQNHGSEMPYSAWPGEGLLGHYKDSYCFLSSGPSTVPNTPQPLHKFQDKSVIGERSYPSQAR